MRRMLAIAILGLALGAAPAGAYPITGAGWLPYQAEPGELAPRALTTREYEALFLARDTWGTPACGTPRVRIRPNIRKPDGQLANGFAWLEGCTIEINDLVVMSRGWVGVCTLIVHEWGHHALHGRGQGEWHSADPQHVMYRLSAFEFGPCLKADRQRRCDELRWRARRARSVRKLRLNRKWRRVCR